MIHSTAVIHPTARLGENVRVGPYVIIDEGVELGPECEIGPYVFITGRAQLGSGNKIHAGAVIGDLPQDLRFRGELTELLIGNNNIIREHVTIHRSNKASESTRIGNDNFFMAGSHIGHNSVIGNHVIIANGSLVAGHVTIEDRVFISATCMLHQFVRVGTLALMQGGSGISKDLPPYTIAHGNNHICGLNVIGLRRAGVNSDDRLVLKQLYHLLFRGTGKFQERIISARPAARSLYATHLLDFLSAGKRGFCTDVSRLSAPSDE
jgi:UDP-N-acetylglucosamine acyltransferase